MTTEDQIKEQTKGLGLSSHKMNLFHPNIGETCKRYFKLRLDDGQVFNLFAYVSKVMIETPIKTTLLFSVSLPDMVCLAKRPLPSSKADKIYTDGSNDRSVAACVDLIKSEIRELALTAGEGLFVFQNQLCLALDKTRRLMPEISALQKIKVKIEHNFPDQIEELNTAAINAEFQELMPLLKEWAISDDLERQEKIDRSSSEELNDLIRLVSPKISLINAYLDGFGNDPLPHEAIPIGNLAELVSELIIDKDLSRGPLGGV